VAYYCRLYAIDQVSSLAPVTSTRGNASSLRRSDIHNVNHPPCLCWSLQGLRIPKRAKEIDGLLKALLVQLEKDKQSISLDATNDKYACEIFALNIFKRADKVDRAGRADVNTSKAYYAASIFIEVRCSPLHYISTW
jgi:hypothetical protein